MHKRLVKNKGAFINNFFKISLGLHTLAPDFFTVSRKLTTFSIVRTRVIFGDAYSCYKQTV